MTGPHYLTRKRSLSEIGQHRVDAIDERLEEIASRFETLYDEVDALSEEVAALRRDETEILRTESMLTPSPGGREVRGICPEFATDPFTITLRTFGHQRRLTLERCTESFLLCRITPLLVEALAMMGLHMNADERNTSTVPNDVFRQRAMETFRGVSPMRDERVDETSDDR